MSSRRVERRCLRGVAESGSGVAAAAVLCGSLQTRSHPWVLSRSPARERGVGDVMASFAHTRARAVLSPEVHTPLDINMSSVIMYSSRD